MDIEYEEFETVEDMFLFMAALTQSMKNIIAVASYKGYVMHMSPTSHAGEPFRMTYVKKELEPGIYEFDISTMSYKKVEGIERADKNYFIIVTPKRNTMADAAIENL